MALIRPMNLDGGGLAPAAWLRLARRWLDSRRLEWIAPLAASGVALGLLRAPTGPVMGGTVAGWWLAGATLVALVLWIVWQDLASFTISDAAVLAIAVLAVALRCSAAADDGDTPHRVIAALAIDGALCGGLMLAFREWYYRRRGIDGLGLGDVKLAAAGALLVGAIGFSWALFAASLAGLTAVAAARLVWPARARTDRIAFGAVLAPAVLAVWVIEQAVPRLVGS